MTRRGRIAIAAFYLVLLAVWQIYGQLTYGPGRLVPPPSTIVDTLWTQRAAYGANALVTVQEAAVGFVVGALGGLALALFIDRFARVGDGVYRLSLALYSVPLIALAPALVTLLGLGFASKAAVAALASFFPVVVNVTTALRLVDPRVIDLGSVLGMGRVRALRLLRLPYAVPSMMASFKIAAPAAFIAAMIAEWVGAERGLGLALLYAMFGFQLPDLWATLVLSTVISGGIYLIFELLARVATPWHATVSATREA